MFRIWFALGPVVLLVGVAVGQEANSPVAPKVAPAAIPQGSSVPGAKEADPAADDRVEYIIEVKILEGKGLFSNDSAWGNVAMGGSAVELLRKSAHRSAEKTTAAGAARDRADSNALPFPPSAMPDALGPLANPPMMHAYQAETAKDSGDDELWAARGLDALDVTTVVVPKLRSFAKQSVTMQMQTFSGLPYLEPLGDGKYQAKSTVVQELGMKVIVAVQPIEGDDAFVELSPLEIQITALDGREPLEGLNLDVGKPIISTRSLKTTAKMKLGATRMIAMPSGPKTQAAMLLRVNRASIVEFAGPPKAEK